MKKIYFAFCLAATLMLWSCNKPASEATPTDSLTTQPAPQKLAAKFVCTEIRSMDDIAPLSELALQVGDQKVIIDSISACGRISADMYDMSKIPTSALLAAGGWWAGGGDYFYLVLDGNDYVVMYGWADEGAEEKDMYQYKEVKRVKAY